MLLLNTKYKNRRTHNSWQALIWSIANILLIEDEASIADNISYALQTEGFKALWEQLRNNGISHLQNNSIELVILATGLPDINGFKVCKSIRKFSDVPIIFLTARSEEIDRIVAL